MKKKNAPETSADDIQVFELTMDDTEDQEELNRQFRKPGEPPYCAPPKHKRESANERTAESSCKKGEKRTPE